MARTRRYNNVLVYFRDENGSCILIVFIPDPPGNRQKIGASGFCAAVLQHEIDHLNGRLELDELETPQSVYFEEEWEKYHAHERGISELGDIKFYKDDDEI